MFFNSTKGTVRKSTAKISPTLRGIITKQTFVQDKTRESTLSLVRFINNLDSYMYIGS
jgi:hypothetical protein